MAISEISTTIDFRDFYLDDTKSLDPASCFVQLICEKKHYDDTVKGGEELLYRRVHLFSLSAYCSL